MYIYVLLPEQVDDEVLFYISVMIEMNVIIVFKVTLPRSETPGRQIW